MIEALFFLLEELDSCSFSLYVINNVSVLTVRVVLDSSLLVPVMKKLLLKDTLIGYLFLFFLKCNHLPWHSRFLSE